MHSRESIIEQFQQVHHQRYAYDRFQYQGIDSKATITCSEHGDFKQTPYSHRKGSGCPHCGIREGARNRIKPWSFYLRQAQQRHGNKYDYSDVTYVNSSTPIRIGCAQHGTFEQIPALHAKGHGCVRCAHSLETRLRNTSNPRSHRVPWSFERFERRAHELHQRRYTYKRTIIRGQSTPVLAFCSDHGPFIVRIPDHLSPKKRTGCPECGHSRGADSRRHDRDLFIRKARLVHGDEFDYSDVVYTGDSGKVSIICRAHGMFEQKATNHLQGNKCPRCAGSISRVSQRWLNELGLPNDSNHREVRGLIPDRRFIVDGFDPETNTVYEFWGDFFHANPEHAKSKYKRSIQRRQCTEEKRKLILSAGYRLWEVWESDYKKGNLGSCALSASIPESKVD